MNQLRFVPRLHRIKTSIERLRKHLLKIDGIEELNFCSAFLFQKRPKHLKEIFTRTAWRRHRHSEGLQILLGTHGL